MEGERELLFSVSKKDLRIDTFRAGGKGGQHQNKTESGVRLTHIETGISAESREHRSQEMNKREAFRKLVDRLIQYYQEPDPDRRELIKTHLVRTYHEADNRIEDHETGMTYSYKHTFGKGKMEEVIDAHTRHVLMSRGSGQ